MEASPQLAVAIPQQRLTLSALGPMGYGKSTAMGNLVKWALDSGQFSRGAFLYCSPQKEEETIPKYPSEVKHIAGRTLPFSHVKWYKDSIIIAEDVMRLDEKSKHTVEQLVSWLARNNRDLVILVSQKSHREYPTALEIHFKWAGIQFAYDVYEGKEHSGNIDWTMQDGKFDISKLIHIVQNGVQRRVVISTKGKPGRSVNPNSFHASCVKAFQEGVTPGEFIRRNNFTAQSKEYRYTHIYYIQWKQQGKSGLNEINKNLG